MKNNNRAEKVIEELERHRNEVEATIPTRTREQEIYRRGYNNGISKAIDVINEAV